LDFAAQLHGGHNRTRRSSRRSGTSTHCLRHGTSISPRAFPIGPPTIWRPSKVKKVATERRLARSSRRRFRRPSPHHVGAQGRQPRRRQRSQDLDMKLRTRRPLCRFCPTGSRSGQGRHRSIRRRARRWWPCSRRMEFGHRWQKQPRVLYGQALCHRKRASNHR
jgi:hypothetical protein